MSTVWPPMRPMNATMNCAGAPVDGTPILLVVDVGVAREPFVAYWHAPWRRWVWSGGNDEQASSFDHRQCVGWWPLPPMNGGAG